LTQGGDAPVEHLEKIAEALKVKANLRKKDRTARVQEANKLHLAYAMRSTMFIVDKFAAWARQNNRKLMVLLSYDVPSVRNFIQKRTRWDGEMLAYLKKNRILHVDCLAKAAQEYKAFKIPVDQFIARHYVGRAGAQVFGHYNPAGNFWFAHAIRQEVVNWMNPKPVSYRKG
jgi:hypothetical protein